MKLTLVLSTLAALGLAASQTIPECVVTCSTQAASSAGCTSFTDVSCVCTNAAFQNAAVACLTANCSPDDQATASGLQAALCAGQAAPSGSVTASLSSTGSASIDSSAIASLTSSGASASSIASSLAESGSAAVASASGASASASATSSGASATSSASASPSSAGVVSSASQAATSAAATSGPSSAATKLDFPARGMMAALVGVLGVGLGAIAVL